LLRKFLIHRRRRCRAAVTLIVYSYIIGDMVFSFFCQKNRFDVNKKFRFYFDYEMAIFDVREQTKVQDSVSVIEDTDLIDNNDEPLSKFKVCKQARVSFKVDE